MRPARNAPTHLARAGRPGRAGRLLLGLVGLGFLAVLLWQALSTLRDSALPPWLNALMAIGAGVGGAFALFAAANLTIEQLPSRWRPHLTPLVFVGPALAILTWYLALPAARSLLSSLYDAQGLQFVGLDNYRYAFTSPEMLTSFRNNLTWLVCGTGLSVGFGLLIAALADRTRPAFEAAIKTVIFMPMAISMVGASLIWRFVYEFRPPGAPQIGLLNAALTAVGGEPQAWLLLQPWNTLLLIAILVWLQTGYAMVILSAAIKAVPGELLEAGRMDGAGELQIFWRITLPAIQGAVVTVATTIMLFTLKIFDIVQSMTGGNYGTQVIANVTGGPRRSPSCCCSQCCR